jgi:hypothetical protein
MRHVFSTALAGLITGAILAAAQWVSPALLPWVIGFMLACIAANLRAAAPWIDKL